MPTIDELAAEVADLGRRVHVAESVLQLQSLKARYGELVDQRYPSGRVADEVTLARLAGQVADLFTDDAVWDGGPGLGLAVGRAAIEERLRTPTLTFSRHLFVAPRIEVDGDRATARWDLLCPCRRGDTSLWMAGFEDDEYRRVGGHWLHRSMRLTTLFVSDVGRGWGDILA